MPWQAISDEHCSQSINQSIKQTMQHLLEATNWASADGKHVLFHLLTALPWPERIATRDTPLSRCLGKLFDETVLERRFRRRVADNVIRWGAYWIKTFAARRWQLLSQSNALNAAVVR
jgi:hypothetical protein